MNEYRFFQLCVLWMIIGRCNGISSPIPSFMKYQYSTELQANVADLHWNVDDEKEEIVFELHIKTTGWIALGISPGKIFVWIFLLNIDYPTSSWWYERCRYCCWMG